MASDVEKENENFRASQNQNQQEDFGDSRSSADSIGTAVIDYSILSLFK